MTFRRNSPSKVPPVLLSVLCQLPGSGPSAEPREPCLSDWVRAGSGVAASTNFPRNSGECTHNSSSSASLARGVSYCLKQTPRALIDVHAPWFPTVHSRFISFVSLSNRRILRILPDDFCRPRHEGQRDGERHFILRQLLVRPVVAWR